MKSSLLRPFGWSCLLLGLVPAGLRAAAPPPPALAPSLQALAPVELLPDDRAGTLALQDRSGSATAATAAWRPSDGSGPVLRVEVPQRSDQPASVTVRWPFRQAAKRGDVVLARFLARAEYARQESGEAVFQFAVEQHRPEFARHVLLPLTAGPDWALFEVPFALVRDVLPEEGEVTLGFGVVAQAVEIAGLQVLNFGPRARVRDLPQTRFSYPGREPDAAWRRAALERIERLRTAPIEVRVLDAQARPKPGARVAVRLARPAFVFGTEVDAAFLLDPSPDAARYRDTLVALFDTAVLGNAFKWPLWSSSPARRAEALRATDWLESRGLRMRGHTLVWPGDKFTPRRIVALPPPKAELPLLIKEHIRDLVTATRGRLIAWDVVNELMHERDYLRYLPESEAAEWFKLARELDPRAKLFLNDYAMLNTRRSPENIARFVDLAARLRAAGAPIDALGVQGHMGRQVRAPADILSDLDLLAASGLEVQITEFDVNTPDEELQADYTRDFLIATYSHPAVTGFTKWGFWEKRHWKPDAGMFRADWSEKPNARVWRELVRGAWLTRTEVTTDAEGRARTRGHLGDYEFTVTVDGREVARQMRPLDARGGTFTLQLP